MNRRSVLLAFGTASIGLGGAFGSGAFSSVEAARTVTLDTSDDSNAVLGFEPVDSDSNIIATETVGSGDRTVIKIEQASLNAQATTRFEDALRVTNGGNNDVGLSVDPAASDDSGLIGNALDIRDASDTSIVDSTNAVDLGAPRGDFDIEAYEEYYDGDAVALLDSDHVGVVVFLSAVTGVRYFDLVGTDNGELPRFPRNPLGRFRAEIQLVSDTLFRRSFVFSHGLRGYEDHPSGVPAPGVFRELRPGGQAASVFLPLTVVKLKLVVLALCARRNMVSPVKGNYFPSADRSGG